MAMRFAVRFAGHPLHAACIVQSPSTVPAMPGSPVAQISSKRVDQRRRQLRIVRWRAKRAADRCGSDAGNGVHRRSAADPSRLRASSPGPVDVIAWRNCRSRLTRRGHDVWIQRVSWTMISIRASGARAQECRQIAPSAPRFCQPLCDRSMSNTCRLAAAPARSARRSPRSARRRCRGGLRAASGRRRFRRRGGSHGDIRRAGTRSAPPRAAACCAASARVLASACKRPAVARRPRRALRRSHTSRRHRTAIASGGRVRTPRRAMALANAARDSGAAGASK